MTAREMESHPTNIGQKSGESTDDVARRQHREDSAEGALQIPASADRNRYPGAEFNEHVDCTDDAGHPILRNSPRSKALPALPWNALPRGSASSSGEHAASARSTPAQGDFFFFSAALRSRYSAKTSAGLSLK